MAALWLPLIDERLKRLLELQARLAPHWGPISSVGVDSGTGRHADEIAADQGGNAKRMHAGPRDVTAGSKQAIMSNRRFLFHSSSPAGTDVGSGRQGDGRIGLG